MLDAGADGIIVPMICSKDDAILAVDYAKYPPIGKHAAWVWLVPSSMEQVLRLTRNGWQRDLVVIAQIEHIDGINNLEEIISVEGIDGTIIGPYDLSGSMGMPGEFEKPVVKRRLPSISISARFIISLWDSMW